METATIETVDQSAHGECGGRESAALSCARAAARQVAEVDQAIAIGLREVRLGRGNIGETKRSVLQLVSERAVLLRSLRRGRFTRRILDSGPREAREILTEAIKPRALCPADERMLREIRLANETPADRRRRLELETIERDLAGVKAQLGLS